MKKLLITFLAATALTCSEGMAQRVLSLEECREMAVSGDKELEQARTKMEISDTYRHGDYHPRDVAAVPAESDVRPHGIHPATGRY